MYWSTNFKIYNIKIKKKKKKKKKKKTWNKKNYKYNFSLMQFIINWFNNKKKGIMNIFMLLYTNENEYFTLYKDIKY